MKMVLMKVMNVEVFYPLYFHTESDCCSCKEIIGVRQTDTTVLNPVLSLVGEFLMGLHNVPFLLF